MSQSLLNQLVKNDTENKKQQQEQTALLEQLVATQNRLLGVEEKNKRAEARTKRRERRSQADNSLKGLMGTKADQKKEKKGMFDWLKGLMSSVLAGLGGVLAGIGLPTLLGALGLAGIGGLIAGYFSSPEFRKFVNTQVSNLVGVIAKSMEAVLLGNPEVLFTV